MVFSSLQFILVFLPIFFTGYYLTPEKYRNAVLLAGSLSFYLVGTINAPGHFVLFVAGIVADFLAGICMEKRQRYKKSNLILYRRFSFDLSLHIQILQFCSR